jgi:hypothetical protein
VFGKIYNISVAVLAVTLVLLVIGGALFAVSLFLWTVITLVLSLVF